MSKIVDKIKGVFSKSDKDGKKEQQFTIQPHPAVSHPRPHHIDQNFILGIKENK
jgi:hypothetical protein